MSDSPLLIMGSRNYSSWSLRPWVFLRKTGVDFRERVIDFDAPDYQAQIAALSPSRRVPLLIDGGLEIWDSLAICEYAAELTGRGLPRERAARARARSVAAEMHSGFDALRSQCPMNVRALHRHVPLTPALAADIARIDAIWSDCLQRFGTAHSGARGAGGGGASGGDASGGADGGWLFGEFSIADAMFAPVAFRFRTYGAALSGVAQRYLAHAIADPVMSEWLAASEREGHPLPDVDAVGLAAGGSPPH